MPPKGNFLERLTKTTRRILEDAWRSAENMDPAVGNMTERQADLDEFDRNIDDKRVSDEDLVAKAFYLVGQYGVAGWSEFFNCVENMYEKRPGAVAIANRYFEKLKKGEKIKVMWK